MKASDLVKIITGGEGDRPCGHTHVQMANAEGFVAFVKAHTVRDVFLRSGTHVGQPVAWFSVPDQPNMHLELAVGGLHDFRQIGYEKGGKTLTGIQVFDDLDGAKAWLRSIGVGRQRDAEIDSYVGQHVGLEGEPLLLQTTKHGEVKFFAENSKRIALIVPVQDQIDAAQEALISDLRKIGATVHQTR